MVKFVRDLQRAASSGDDIEGVVSTQMKTDFKREKELNQRLSEELQRCEKERLRLLERIKLLSGEKQVVLESTDGMKRTFKVTKININRILDELRAAKSTLSQNEELVHRSRDVVREVEGEIDGKEIELASLRKENDELGIKFDRLEKQYRDTLYLHEGAQQQMDGMHRMHVKLLACRQLEESLQKVIECHTKAALDQMKYVTRGYVTQFGAIYRLRCFFKHRD